MDAQDNPEPGRFEQCPEDFQHRLRYLNAKVTLCGWTVPPDWNSIPADEITTDEATLCHTCAIIEKHWYPLETLRKIPAQELTTIIEYLQRQGSGRI